VVGWLVSGERISSIKFVVLKCCCKIAVQGSDTATFDDFCLRAAGLRTATTVRSAGFDVERIVRDSNLLNSSLGGAFLRTFGRLLGSFGGRGWSRRKARFVFFPRVSLRLRHVGGNLFFKLVVHPPDSSQSLIGLVALGRSLAEVPCHAKKVLRSLTLFF